ncbi:MAG: hypothetical protein LIO47_03735 [Akkermansia sp.]|nr:hypothetical protein [Akkermansia sp.]
MKKTQVLRYIIYLVVLAIINALYYGIWGLDHSTSAWISYGFIHLAAALVIATPFIADKGRENYLYTAVLNTVASIYLAIEYIYGCFFIVVQPKGYKFALFSQLILLALFLVAYLVNMIANAHTAEAVAEQEANLAYVKESASVLKSLLTRIENETTYRKVEGIYDLINSSPVKSDPKVRALELQVKNEIDNLCGAVGGGNEAAIAACADKISQLANERNRLLRLQ